MQEAWRRRRWRLLGRLVGCSEIMGRGLRFGVLWGRGRGLHGVQKVLVVALVYTDLCIGWRKDEA